MYNEVSIVCANSAIQDFDIEGRVEQKNCFLVMVGFDLTQKTVTNSTVRLYDQNTKTYVDCYVYYSKKNISITPKEGNLIPGRQYTIQLKSGPDGIRTILGAYATLDSVYDITFNDEVLIEKPKILAPANNSNIDSVNIEIDLNGSDSIELEISDNLDFTLLVVSEEISTASYAPVFEFAENEQYFVRARGKKTIISDGTSEALVYYSPYSDTVQFFYRYGDIETEEPLATMLKSIPEDGATYVTDKKVVMMFDSDITGYTATSHVYMSDYGLYDFCRENIEVAVLAGMVEEVVSTTVAAKSAVIVNIDSIATKTAYHVIVELENEGAVIEKMISFKTPRRTLYIDYDYIRADVSQFDVDSAYVMDKIEKACDRADYLSVIRIRDTDIKYKVKEYVRYKVLCDMVVDYQLGYIDLVSGAIGSFQFEISGAVIDGIQEALKALRLEMKLWEDALKGYEKPGKVPPDWAQRGASGTITRTSI